jgi:hypothetical protein
MTKNCYNLRSVYCLFITIIITTEDHRINRALAGGARLSAKLCEFLVPSESLCRPVGISLHHPGISDPQVGNSCFLWSVCIIKCGREAAVECCLLGYSDSVPVVYTVCHHNLCDSHLCNHCHVLYVEATGRSEGTYGPVCRVGSAKLELQVGR